jgi:carboxyl-terminal processing protease
MRAVLFALVIGFSTSTFAAAPASDLLPPGAWRSDGYGAIAQANARKVQTFDISAAGCVRGPSYPLTAFRDLYGAAIVDAGVVSLHRGVTREPLRAEPRLPEVCRNPLRSRDVATSFNIFSATFAERYAFFGERGVNWPEQTRAARARLESGADLFDVLVDMVRPLNDGHVTITAGKREYDPETIVAPGAAPDGNAWTWRTLRASLREIAQAPAGMLTTSAALVGNRRVLSGRLTAEIAYVAILAEGAWAEGQTEATPVAQHVDAAARVLDEIFASAAGAKGLVLDLRVNSGGFDAVALEIASRFADERRVVFRKQAGDATPAYDVIVEPSSRTRFAGPVVVLIGANTVSAGESLALAMASLPHARLIGQPTRGILSDAIPKTLPNGWTFTLSVESYRTPEGALVEVAGVQPDETTQAPTSADPQAMWGRDLERAVLLLTPGRTP